MGKEAWRGLAIMLVAVIVAYVFLAWRPLTAGLGSHPPLVVAGSAFDPATECDLPYTTDRVAELCLNAKSSSATVWAAWLSLIGIGVSAFVAWKSYQAAQASADIARQTHEAERARLLCSVTSFKMLAYVNNDLSIEGGHYDFEVIWKNYGKRAAVGIVTTRGASRARPKNLPSLTISRAPPMGESNTLGPDGDLPARVSGKVKEDSVWFSDEWHYYALFAIEYADVLDKTRRFNETAMFRIKAEKPECPGKQSVTVYVDDVVIRDGKVLGVWHELPNQGRDFH